MNLATWAGRNLHRAVDLDGRFGPQCMDLINSYLAACYPGARASGNASNARAWRLPGWVWIGNLPYNAPLPGCLVVWYPNVQTVGTGEFGHTAVGLCADPETLITLDQNWAGVLAAQVVIHNYLGVMGWWAPPHR